MTSANGVATLIVAGVSAKRAGVIRTGHDFATLLDRIFSQAIPSKTASSDDSGGVGSTVDATALLRAAVQSCSEQPCGESSVSPEAGCGRTIQSAAQGMRETQRRNSRGHAVSQDLTSSNDDTQHASEQIRFLPGWLLDGMSLAATRTADLLSVDGGVRSAPPDLGPQSVPAVQDESGSTSLTRPETVVPPSAATNNVSSTSAAKENECGTAVQGQPLIPSQDAFPSGENVVRPSNQIDNSRRVPLDRTATAPVLALPSQTRPNAEGQTFQEPAGQGPALLSAIPVSWRHHVEAVSITQGATDSASCATAATRSSNSRDDISHAEVAAALPPLHRYQPRQMSSAVSQRVDAPVRLFEPKAESSARLSMSLSGSETGIARLEGRQSYASQIVQDPSAVQQYSSGMSTGDVAAESERRSIVASVVKQASQIGEEDGPMPDTTSHARAEEAIEANCGAKRKANGTTPVDASVDHREPGEVVFSRAASGIGNPISAHTHAISSASPATVHSESPGERTAASNSDARHNSGVQRTLELVNERGIADRFARLTDHAGRAEMHVSLRVPDIGRLELHASAAESHVSAALTVESRDLRHALLDDVAGLTSLCTKQDMDPSQLVISDVLSEGSAASGGDSRRNHPGRDESSAQQQVVADEKNSLRVEDEPVDQEGSTRLNINV